MRRSDEVSGDSTEFRSGAEEVLKLLEECGELRRTLKTISGQLGRMENRVKRAFPVEAKIIRERQVGSGLKAKTSITPEQALVEFDRLVALAASGANDEAQRSVESKSSADLLAIAKELGVSFSKNKPSLTAMREAIFGKIRESVLLTRHNPRSS
jgi:hypothetical protein